MKKHFEKQKISKVTRGPRRFPIAFNNDISCILFEIHIFYQRNDNIVSKIIFTILANLPRSGRDEMVVKIFKLYVLCF